MLDLVLQEDEGGCGIACIATVTGKSYKEVAKDFEKDFNKIGLDMQEIMDYLGNEGFSIVYKTVSHFAKKNFAEKEMLRPFAPIHIVKLMPYFDSEWAHVVVMDEKGKFHCPGGVSHCDTKKSYAFTEIIGIYGLDYFLKSDIISK